MSHGPQPLPLELVHQIRAGWKQAVACAIRGDLVGVTAALDGAQDALTLVLAQAKSSFQAPDRQMLQQLLDESAQAVAELETALAGVEAGLAEVRAQQAALRLARVAVNRLLPQPRWVDERV